MLLPKTVSLVALAVLVLGCSSSSNTDRELQEALDRIEALEEEDTAARTTRPAPTTTRPAPTTTRPAPTTTEAQPLLLTLSFNCRRNTGLYCTKIDETFCSLGDVQATTRDGSGQIVGYGTATDVRGIREEISFGTVYCYAKIPNIAIDPNFSFYELEIAYGKHRRATATFLINGSQWKNSPGRLIEKTITIYDGSSTVN